MKPHHRAVIDYLRELGAADVHMAPGGRHPRIVFTWDGRERKLVVSSSPATVEGAIGKACAEIRKMLGLDEKHRHHVEKRPRPRYRRRTAPAPSPPVLTTVQRDDWRERLSQHPAAIASLSARLDAAWKAWFREILERQPA